MFDKKITIFNRYHSRLGDLWFPHVIDHVQIVTDKASMVAKYGADSKDSASIFIHFDKEGDNILIDGIPYLSPKKWAALPNDQLKDYITLNDNAQLFDFILLGEYPEEVIEDNNYIDGFYNHINNAEDYVYAITSVGGPYTLIPHFEILAK